VYKYLAILSVVALIFTFRCTTELTKGAEAVKLIMKQEAPAEYELIGDIATSGAGEPTIIGVKNNLRNKTAELGGDLVVVDTIEMHGEGDREWYSGNARAYKLKKK
jgi:hypothetical protein